MSDRYSRLKYKPGLRNAGAKVQYRRWRKDRGLPDQCDNPDCRFHTEPLVWNGRPLALVIDHKNGVNTDDRPINLQYLCPNCHAQTPTYGGGNKGRVRKSAGGFGEKPHETGLWGYTLVADTPGRYEMRGSEVTVQKATLISADCPHFGFGERSKRGE